MFNFKDDEKTIFTTKPLKKYAVRLLLLVTLITYAVILVPFIILFFNGYQNLFYFMLGLIGFSCIVVILAYLYQLGKTTYKITTKNLYINLSNGDLIIFPLNNQFEIVNELRMRQKNPKVCDIIIRSPQKTVEKKRSFLFRSPLADGILAAAKKMRIYAIVNPSEFCDMLKNNAKQVGQGVTVPSFRA